jgi:plasmid stability protein
MIHDSQFTISLRPGFCRIRAIRVIRGSAACRPCSGLTTKMKPLWLLLQMPTITLKNLPRELHRQLKTRAKTHRRSLNGEVIATLQAAIASSVPLDETLLEESVRHARSLFRRPVTARQIDAWKRAGRL